MGEFPLRCFASIGLFQYAEVNWASVFPNKGQMIRSANILWAIFCVAPFVWIIIAAQVTLGGHALTRSQVFISTLFLALSAVSIANGVPQFSSR